MSVAACYSELLSCIERCYHFKAVGSSVAREKLVIVVEDDALASLSSAFVGLTLTITFVGRSESLPTTDTSENQAGRPISDKSKGPTRHIDKTRRPAAKDNSRLPKGQGIRKSKLAKCDRFAAVSASSVRRGRSGLHRSRPGHGSTESTGAVASGVTSNSLTDRTEDTVTPEIHPESAVSDTESSAECDDVRHSNNIDDRIVAQQASSAQHLSPSSPCATAGDDHVSHRSTPTVDEASEPPSETKPVEIFRRLGRLWMEKRNTPKYQERMARLQVGSSDWDKLLNYQPENPSFHRWVENADQAKGLESEIGIFNKLYRVAAMEEVGRRYIPGFVNFAENEYQHLSDLYPHVGWHDRAEDRQADAHADDARKKEIKARQQKLRERLQEGFILWWLYRREPGLMLTVASGISRDDCPRLLKSMKEPDVMNLTGLDESMIAEATTYSTTAKSLYGWFYERGLPELRDRLGGLTTEDEARELNYWIGLLYAMPRLKIPCFIFSDDGFVDFNHQGGLCVQYPVLSTPSTTRRIATNDLMQKLSQRNLITQSTENMLDFIEVLQPKGFASNEQAFYTKEAFRLTARAFPMHSALSPGNYARRGNILLPIAQWLLAACHELAIVDLVTHRDHGMIVKSLVSMSSFGLLEWKFRCLEAARKAIPSSVDPDEAVNLKWGIDQRLYGVQRLEFKGPITALGPPPAFPEGPKADEGTHLFKRETHLLRLAQYHIDANELDAADCALSALLRLAQNHIDANELNAADRVPSALEHQQTLPTAIQARNDKHKGLWLCANVRRFRGDFKAAYEIAQRVCDSYTDSAMTLRGSIQFARISMERRIFSIRYILTDCRKLLQLKNRRSHRTVDLATAEWEMMQLLHEIVESRVSPAECKGELQSVCESFEAIINGFQDLEPTLTGDRDVLGALLGRAMISHLIRPDSEAVDLWEEVRVRIQSHGLWRMDYLHGIVEISQQELRSRSGSQEDASNIKLRLADLDRDYHWLAMGTIWPEILNKLLSRERNYSAELML